MHRPAIVASCVALLALLALLACHGTKPLPAPPVVQYKAQSQGAEALAAFDSAAADFPFAAVGDARGVPNLRTVQLPIDTREIRIAGHGATDVEPLPLLRIVQKPRATIGEVLLYWTERLGETRVRDAHPGRPVNCTVAERGVRTCVMVGEVTPPVDWPAVARRFSELGAWTLPPGNACGSGAGGLAPTLLVQRLVGRRFTKYACASADPETHGDARAIYDYFQQVTRQAR